MIFLITMAIFLFFILILIFMIVAIYNVLVKLRNRVKNAWSQIDVQLKRRHDLIPNLVETAKGYMTHEAETFTKVTEARAKALAAGNGGVNEVSQAETALSGALSNFLLTVENYPELKANENFLALSEELTSTENKLAFSRQSYNDETMFYNNKIEMFPSNIIAGFFKFTVSEFFEVDSEAEKEAPKVSF